MTALSAYQAAPGAGDRSMPFEPVEGGAETTSAEAMLVAAYILMWAAFMAFTWLTMLRQKRIASKLDELERGLAQKGDHDPPA
jgi:hypothetical protein